MAKPVIGRDSEIAAGDRFLDALPRGPAALLVEGEPGIGKTTVWGEVVSRAGTRSYTVLSSQAVEAEAKVSYAALGDLLGGVGDEALAPLPKPQRIALEVALLRRDPKGAPRDHRAVSVALVALVRHLSGDTPIVLAVDDVQWLDRSTRAALEFAVRRIAALAVGILLTIRPPQGAAPLAVDRAVPADRVHRLALKPLSVAALHHILRDVLGPAFPRPVLVRIADLSGGNPFFALEIGRALLRTERGLSPRGALPVPDSLRDLVSGRLEALTAGTRRALLVAAALSRPTIDIVRAAGRKDAAVALRRAEKAGIVQLEGARVRFAHPLLRSLCYESAPEDARRRLHRRLAGVAGDPEEAARHLALGATGPDRGVAAALDEAARRARARGAPDSAAELLELAVDLTPPGGEDDRRRRRLELARRRFASGDTAGAGRVLEELAEEIPPGVGRAEALRLLGVVRYHDASFAPAAAVFEQALDEAGEDPVLRGSIGRGLAWTVLVYGDPPRSAREARAAMEITEGTGDDGALAEALGIVALTEFLLGRDVPRVEMDRALALEDPDREAPVEWRPSMIHATLLKYLDDLDAGRSVLESLLRRREEAGDEGALPFILFHLSELECWAGDWEAAARLASRGLSFSVLTGQETFRAANLYAQALVDAHRGLVDPARRAAEEGFALAMRAGLAPTMQWNASVLGFLELSLGDPEATHGRLGPIAEFLATMGIGEPSVPRLVPDEIEALVAMGELAQARRLLDPFEERAHALSRRWAMATAGRCRALVAAAERDLDGALAAVEGALEHHRGLPMPFERGRTLLVAGQVRRRARQRGAAAESLREALRTFEDLGAPLWATKASAEFERVGGRAAAPADLTATERRVAELAASGLTNREIAAAAFISPKTVEAALGRVYRKLGIRSRAELGARMAERRAGGQPPKN